MAASGNGMTFYCLSIFLLSWFRLMLCVYIFHDGGSYHIETSPLIYSANQWTDFYIIGVSVMKELTNIHISVPLFNLHTESKVLTFVNTVGKPDMLTSKVFNEKFIY